MTKVEALAPGETLALRQRVLRPHQTQAESVLPGDEAPDAFHAGVRVDGAWVAVGSIFPEREPRGQAPEADWRIRGMAVAPEVRGGGLGRAVLGALVARATRAGGHAIWCNARSTASGFYTRAGFRIRGEPFELPGIGPHVVMSAPLGAGGPLHP